LENYPHSSLSDYLDDLFSRNKFVGFKLLYEHYIKNKKELDDYFSKNDVKFIFIKRKDTIKQAISHKLKKSEQFKNKIYVKYE
jgi:LPS sulfotransferase NodH